MQACIHPSTSTSSRSGVLFFLSLAFKRSKPLYFSSIRDAPKCHSVTLYTKLMARPTSRCPALSFPASPALMNLSPACCWVDLSTYLDPICWNHSPAAGTPQPGLYSHSRFSGHQHNFLLLLPKIQDRCGGGAVAILSGRCGGGGSGDQRILWKR